MKHIGRNHLSHCSQVLILNEKEEVILVQQGFEMEWTLKKEEKLAFAGYAMAMKIALKGKNKIGFINGTCVKQETSDVLSQRWEREESHMGLDPSSSSYSKIQLVAFIAKTNNNATNFNRRVNGNNNNNDNRGPNPNLLYKNCGLIGHTIERCYEIIGYPAGFKKNLNLSRQTGNKNNKRFNANSEGNHFVHGTYGSISSSFTNEHMVKLLSLINEKPTFAANMWIIDYGANQHMIDSTKNMFNVVDVSSLMHIVGHPNGTLAKISAIGSLRLTSGIVLFDVLVVPEYNNLNLGKLVGTGSVTGGIYLFDLDKIEAYKLYSLDSKTVFYSREVKFYENVFSFKMKNSNVFPQESNDENILKFFDVQNPESPYGEEGDTSTEDGSSRITSDDCTVVEDEVARGATHIEENVTSKGNVPVNQNGEGQSNPMGASLELRRSTRPKVMLARFNDFVVNSSVRYGLEKYRKYCLELLNEYVLLACKPAATPLQQNVVLCLVSWKGKKQATISRFSTESKYRCLASTTCEIIWVVKILKDLGVKGLLPVNLYCDSSFAISIAENPVFMRKQSILKLIFIL
nr:hypothetical protein [Tanacetum cinerariifolium]